MTKMTRTKDIAIELSAKAFNDDGAGEVEGYASIFGNIDHARDVIERGAFTKTIQMNKGKIRFLWQHDRYQPIGAITELYEDDKGLYFKAKFAPTPKGQEARELLKMDGAMGGFSIGFQVILEMMDELSGVNRIKEIRLLEVSAVTFPCNEAAVVVGVKSEDEFNEDEAALLEKFKAFLMSQRTEGQSDGVPEGSEGNLEAVEDAQAEDEAPVAAAPEEESPEDVVKEKSDDAELLAVKEALELFLLTDKLRSIKF